MKMTSFRSASLFAVAFLAIGPSRAQTPAQLSTPTVIAVGSAVQRSSVKRLGVNLGTQSFYDSGIMMKNLAFRNPGFEGETWQSILHCKAASATICTDDNPYSAWPANFFAGARFEVITGPAVGETGAVLTNTSANRKDAGITIDFTALSHPLAAGSYIVVRMSIPGNAQAGWWTSGQNNPSFSTEFNDLSPNTPGKQALRISALGTGQSAGLNSYFDSNTAHSFVRVKGPYTLTFRAKGLGGNNKVNLSFERTAASGGNSVFFTQTVQLANSWQDYTLTFSPAETGVKGVLSLGFSISGAAMLLDDVSLTPAPSATNPTAFRDEVVGSLRSLNPGILRYMDSGTNWGSSLNNMLAPAFARTRGGYSNWNTLVEDIPLGLHDFLVLCHALNVEPWYTMQTGMTTVEMNELMDYLGGSTATVYGARRAALGQAAPWTSIFPKIHLEFGNEVWNTANPGAGMTDPVSYAQRATTIFAAARASASYKPSAFDLVADGWAALPYWNEQVLAAGSNFDTIDVAPYLFYSFNDASSTEAIFGPMFAQPELLDSTAAGDMQQQAVAAATAKRPARLAVYETNLSTFGGTVSQTAVNTVVPSLGAGIVSVEHMLLMLRDLGITDQNMFALAGYQNAFSNPANPSETTPIFGAVVDMGGDSGNVRPEYLAHRLANTAIRPTMLVTSLSGANPTWNQPKSRNDDIALNGAHYLQSFSFTDGTTNKLVLFNLSRTAALPVSFTGPNAPTGSVTRETLTSASITDNNEGPARVGVAATTLSLGAGDVLKLPPFSMVVLTSAAPATGPSPRITGVTVSCPQPALNAGASEPCTASVTGTGAYNPAVTWRSSVGSISSAGVFTAPAASTSEVATITAVSTQDATRSGVTTVSIKLSAAQPSFAVACAPSVVYPGTQIHCTATLNGVAQSNVTWASSLGSIYTTGVLDIPANATGAADITGTLAGQPGKVASIHLVITPPPVVTSVTASCQPLPASPGAQIQCSATVSGSGAFDPGVDWRTSAGTIYTTGVLNIPATATGTVLVTAASKQTPTVSATVPVSLAPLPTITSVAITCSPAPVHAGAQLVCSSVVQGTGAFDPGVTWSATTGTIYTTGVYNVPQNAPGMVTLSARSNQDPGKSASAAVTVLPPGR